MPLPPYVANLDAAERIEQEAWLDEKNKNIAVNAERARNCAISHEALVKYIGELPEC